MTPDGLKVDLHVHSNMSDRPSQWVLQKISCPESFTSPLALYKNARQRGMDLVTITDHNTISEILEIAHLPDTFISEEVTTYFPEGNRNIHVLALDITEAQHRQITRLRKNVYELTDYFRKAGLNIDLIIVGDGPYRAHMQAQLYGSRALFTGELTGDALSQAFASSDLFVFPSSTDTYG